MVSVINRMRKLKAASTKGPPCTLPYMLTGFSQRVRLYHAVEEKALINS